MHAPICQECSVESPAHPIPEDRAVLIFAPVTLLAFGLQSPHLSRAFAHLCVPFSACPAPGRLSVLSVSLSLRLLFPAAGMVTLTLCQPVLSGTTSSIPGLR